MRYAPPSLRPRSPGSAGPAEAVRVQLRLLNAFEVECDGHAVRLPSIAQRLVAFVALHERPVERGYVAGMLWLDTPDQRAAGNLRTALWRVQARARGLLDASGHRLRLEPGVRVDLRVAEQEARREINGADASCDAELFAGDVLPDWYDDDWVILERERFRQLRLRALDALCERHLRAGRHGQALEVGLLSLAGEPLRESAHRALVGVHLADGNAVEALRQYRLCRRLLHDQLGIEPTQKLLDLIGTLDELKTNG
jgi:DNA-binding SARP family transcriptional activator